MDFLFEGEEGWANVDEGRRSSKMEEEEDHLGEQVEENV